MRKAWLGALALLCAAGAAQAQQGSSGYAFGSRGSPGTAFGAVQPGPAWGAYPGYAPSYQPYPAYPAYPYYVPPGAYQGYPQPASPELPAPQGAATDDGPPQGNAVLPYAASEPATGGSGYLVPGMPMVPPVEIGDDDGPRSRHRFDDEFHRDTKEKCWASFDYTMSFFRDMHSAGPLATVGSPLDPHPTVLGQPGTVVIFGDNNIGLGMYSGIKANAGLFLDADDHLSVEVVGWYVLLNHKEFGFASDNTGSPPIGRPAFDVVAGKEIAFVDALPGQLVGGVGADVRSQLIGGEINARYHGYTGDRFHLDGLVGFRYLRLAESLSIHDQFTPLTDNAVSFEGVPVPAGSAFSDLDRFATSNDFYGGQIGARVQWEGDWVVVGLFGKVGLGVTDQRVDISGSTTVTTPDGVARTAVGGVLALPSNIGSHDRTSLGFISEGGIDFGVNVTKHVQLSVGYSFLFWNQVLRPGGQIDRGINTNQVPTANAFGGTSGPVRPLAPLGEEAFWAHTICVGLTIHF
jgi:hypothetical protein